MKVAREYYKSWKAYSHAGNDKNYRNLSESWRSFAMVAEAPALIAGGASDLLKGRINGLLQKEQFVQAAADCSLVSIKERYDLEGDFAKSIQGTHLVNVFKTLARKHHADPGILSEQWVQACTAVGDVSCIMACGRIPPPLNTLPQVHETFKTCENRYSPNINMNLLILVWLRALWGCLYR